MSHDELLDRIRSAQINAAEEVVIQDLRDKGVPPPPINDHIMQFFEYGHLPEPLQEISRMFHTLAWAVAENVPRNPERTVALRKLLEAKDAAVRARIAQ